MWKKRQIILQIYNIIAIYGGIQRIPSLIIKFLFLFIYLREIFFIFYKSLYRHWHSAFMHVLMKQKHFLIMRKYSQLRSFLYFG